MTSDDGPEDSAEETGERDRPDIETQLALNADPEAESEQEADQ